MYSTHRVYVTADKMSLLWSEEEILATEGDDARLRGAPREYSHSVRVETTAGDDVL